MSLTLSQARDEMQALFLAAWTAETPAVNGGAVPPIAWPGVDTGAPPPVTAAHARFFLKHGPRKQRTFGQTGSRRFTAKGLITIQIFTPLSNRTGLTLAENLATIARNAYEGVGTATGIWFRNVRVHEIGPDSGLYQFNTLAEFEYDELK